MLRLCRLRRGESCSIISLPRTLVDESAKPAQFFAELRQGTKKSIGRVYEGARFIQPRWCRRQRRNFRNRHCDQTPIEKRMALEDPDVLLRTFAEVRPGVPEIMIDLSPAASSPSVKARAQLEYS